MSNSCRPLGHRRSMSRTSAAIHACRATASPGQDPGLTSAWWRRSSARRPWCRVRPPGSIIAMGRPVPPAGPTRRREREVVALVAMGATGREIAEELQIAHDTVRTHVRNAMTRLGARSRAHLVAKALGGGHIFG